MVPQSIKNTTKDIYYDNTCWLYNYHTLSTFDDSNAAIDFYKKALGAKKIEYIPLPSGGVAHATIEIGNARLMMSDAKPEFSNKSAKTLGGSPISFYVYLDNVETAFAQAKDTGMTEIFPVTEQFWGDKMGALIDPFGITWTLAQHVRDVSSEDIIAESNKVYGTQSK